tara:strand:- start:2671 stop:3873 length:1203 start_codon:yes stop_codon:yes gene_type:complete
MNLIHILNKVFVLPLGRDNLNFPVDAWYEGVGWCRALVKKVSMLSEDKYRVWIHFPELAASNIVRTITDGTIRHLRIIQTGAFYGWKFHYETPCRILYFNEKNEFQYARILYEFSDTVRIRVGLKEGGHRLIIVEKGDPRIQPYYNITHLTKNGREFFDSVNILEKILMYKEGKKQEKDRNKQDRKILLQKVREDKSYQPISPLTVQFYKNNPQLCLQSCIAYKKGWINQFGKPNTWLFATRNTKHSAFSRSMCTSLIQNVSDYFDAYSFKSASCVNRYICRVLIDPHNMHLLLDRHEKRNIFQNKIIMYIKADLLSIRQDPRLINAQRQVVKYMSRCRLTESSESNWDKMRRHMNNFYSFKTNLCKRHKKQQSQEALFNSRIPLIYMFREKLHLYKNPV